MFREIRFYDDYTAAVASPWWIFALLGVDFVLVGVLIVIFQQLLAWLVAGCLIFNGLPLLGVATVAVQEKLPQVAGSALAAMNENV